MYEEKLSIIIPTKNRQKYAFKCVEAILANKQANFELVIQDNSDNDSLKDMLAEIVDDRLVYSYEAKCLSFCDNFERAIKASSGDYLVLIGDDDGINEDIYEIVDLARQKGIDALLYATNISYVWPNAYGNEEEKGTLIIRDIVAKAKKVSCKKSVKKMCRKGNFNYQDYNFPKIYHGVVKRELFDKVAKKTGHYFSGLTPDIYGAVALSAHVDSMVYINYALTYSGVCATSGSADSATGRHRGELKDAPHFRGTVDYKWDERIPYVYSVGTIWAETAIKAFEENDIPFKINDFNYTAYLVKENKSLKERFINFYTEKHHKSKFFTKIRLAFKIFGIKVKSFFYRGTLFVYRKMVGRHVYKNVSDIGQAMQIAKQHNAQKKILCKVEKKLNKLVK